MRTVQFELLRPDEIVAERERNGPFSGPLDLCRVRGIGKATVERILPFVATVTGGKEKRE